MIIEFNRTFDREDKETFYFKVIGGSGKEYGVCIKLDKKKIIKNICDCTFGTIEEARLIKTNILCRHIRESIDLLKYLGYYNEIFKN